MRPAARVPWRLLTLSPGVDVPRLPGKVFGMGDALALVLCGLGAALVVLPLLARMRSGLSHQFDPWEVLAPVMLLSEPAGITLGGLFAHHEVRHWQRTRRFEELRLSLLSPPQLVHVMLARALRPLLRWLLLALIALEGWYLLFASIDVPPRASGVFAAGLLLTVLNLRLALIAGAWGQVALSLGWEGVLRPLWALLNHAMVHSLWLFLCLMVTVACAMIADAWAMSWEWIGVMLVFVVSALAIPHWALKLAVTRAWARRVETVTFEDIAP